MANDIFGTAFGVIEFAKTVQEHKLETLKIKIVTEIDRRQKILKNSLNTYDSINSKNIPKTLKFKSKINSWKKIPTATSFKLQNTVDELTEGMHDKMRTRIKSEILEQLKEIVVNNNELILKVDKRTTEGHLENSHRISKLMMKIGSVEDKLDEFYEKKDIKRLIDNKVSALKDEVDSFSKNDGFLFTLALVAGCATFYYLYNKILNNLTAIFRKKFDDQARVMTEQVKKNKEEVEKLKAANARLRAEVERKFEVQEIVVSEIKRRIGLLAAIQPPVGDVATSSDAPTE